MLQPTWLTPRPNATLRRMSGGSKGWSRRCDTVGPVLDSELRVPAAGQMPITPPVAREAINGVNASPARFSILIKFSLTFVVVTLRVENALLLPTGRFECLYTLLRWTSGIPNVIAAALFARAINRRRAGGRKRKLPRPAIMSRESTIVACRIGQPT